MWNEWLRAALLACLWTAASGFQGALLARSLLASRQPLGATTADFRTGLTFESDGTPMRLLEFLHVKPGKGAAFVRTKIKNLVTGGIQEKTFRAGETIVLADVAKAQMQYTYSDGDLLCFMNMETFEEVRIRKADIPNVSLMKEGLVCTVSTWNEKVIDVVLPKQAEYVVVETPPSFKGNTASSTSYKPATLDSGAVVNVPHFIEVGQTILVDTAEAKYVGKA